MPRAVDVKIVSNGPKLPNGVQIVESIGIHLDPIDTDDDLDVEPWFDPRTGEVYEKAKKS